MPFLVKQIKKKKKKSTAKYSSYINYCSLWWNTPLLPGKDSSGRKEPCEKLLWERKGLFRNG
jgi:hypothetical protein